MKNAINFLQGQLQGAHDLLLGTLIDLTPEQAAEKLRAVSDVHYRIAP